MAFQLGLPLVPDTSYYYPRFYLGLPESEKMELQDKADEKKAQRTAPAQAKHRQQDMEL